MKTKKVLPLISLLFVAIMLLSVGMIAKEYRERQQDIKGFEKLAEIITEAEQTEITGDVEQTETPQEQKQSSRNLTPLFEARMKWFRPNQRNCWKGILALRSRF